MRETNAYRITLLPGDGIGPEVLREACRVLEAVAARGGFSFTFEEHLVGGAAIDAAGDPFPATSLAACRASDGVLLGAVGGPAWDHLTGAMRPESGLLRLRKELAVYANLRPVAVPASLCDASPLREERVAGTDLLIVRELTGGIYFGTPRGVETVDGERRGFNTMVYTESEIERVARIAFERAAGRSGRVTLVDKANVLEVSRLWRDVVPEVGRREFPGVALDMLYVDNAAMQLVLAPTRFDVVLTANLFGDILSDLAATLVGSLGMLPSASVGGAVGLFEPVHGSAPDLAGRNVANPIAAILSAALLLDELGRSEAARAVRRGVERALEQGLRTGDLWREGTRRVHTDEMGATIARLAVEAYEEVTV